MSDDDKLLKYINVPVIPDPACQMSLAIAMVESVAHSFHELGRFWMKQGDKSHGKRCFANEDAMLKIAKEMRDRQWHLLHPPPVGTPTKAEKEAVHHG